MYIHLIYMYITMLICLCNIIYMWTLRPIYGIKLSIINDPAVHPPDRNNHTIYLYVY